MNAQEADASDITRNTPSFRVEAWQDHFDNLRHGAILCDIDSQAVRFWSEDESIYKLYPSSVPLTEELTRRGYTEVIRKVEGPIWRPTPSMKERNLEWPDYWPKGTYNPLCTHALYYLGSTIEFTEPAIRARSAVNHPMAVLVCLTKILRSSLNSQMSQRRSERQIAEALSEAN